MRRQIAAAAVAAMVCVACARSQDNRNPSDQANGSAKNPIKVTGCLQSAEQAVGTTGTTAGASDTKYMLTHARTEATQPQSSTAPTGASVAEREPARTEGTQGGSRLGTSSTAKTEAPATDRDSARTQGTQGGPQTGSTYRLDGEDHTLSPEIGHQVEIVAMMEDSGVGSSNSGSSMPKVKVQSVRMIAATCPSE